MPQDAMYIEIYKELKHKILEGVFKAGDILPTEADLAASHYTSRITIRKAMDKLKDEGFIKRISGRGTFVNDDFNAQNKDKRKSIGVVLCNVGASFGLGILTAIEETCEKLGYNLIFKNSRDSSKLESASINELVLAGVSGIIVQPIHREYYNKHLIFHHFNKFPFVLVDRHFVGFNIPSVSTNNFGAAADMTEYILSRGHREICFVCCDPSHTSTIEERVSGFKSTCILHGLAVTEKNLLSRIESPHLLDKSESWEKDLTVIHDHLTAHPEITCLFSSEHTITRQLLQVTEQINARESRHFSLAAFDCSEGLYDHRITRIEQDQFEIGKCAAEILHRRISGENISDKLLIPHRLVAGYTVADLASPQEVNPTDTLFPLSACIDE